MLTFFIGDLLPIIVIMLLGYFSGRRETFSEDQARAFNKLVLNYAFLRLYLYLLLGQTGK